MTVPLLQCDFCNGCCCFSISCWGIQNFCVDESNNCLTEVSYGHVPECACSTNLTLFDCAQFNYCCSAQIPYGSVTIAECFCCCDSSTNCNPRRTNYTLIPCYIGTNDTSRFSVQQARLCNPNLCSCCSYSIGHAQRLNTTSNGVIALHSCTNCSLFMLAPMSVRKCLCNPSGCNFCCVGKCIKNTYRVDLGQTGWEIWKLTRCTGSNEFCTVPACIVKDEGYGHWRMGYLNKAKTLMYGEQTKFCHCYCCSGVNLCEAISCGFMHVQTIDDDFCLSPYHGCIASTNRTFTSYLHRGTSGSQVITCLEGQRRFWPLTEDDNGWVLWTEPVNRYQLECVGDFRTKYVCLTCSYLRVGAFKPISTGCGLSSNIVCVCYDATGAGNYLCVAGYNFNTEAYITGCDAGVWRCNGINAPASARRGVAFKNFVVMLDVHPAVTAGNANLMLNTDSDATGLAHPIEAVYSCCPLYTCVPVNLGCCGGYLPMTAIADSNFDSTECKSYLKFASWIALSHMCSQNCEFVRMCCSPIAVAADLNKVNFCVDNATCCLYLTSCDGTFADYPCYYNGTTNAGCCFLCVFKQFFCSADFCNEKHLAKTRTDLLMGAEQRILFSKVVNCCSCFLYPLSAIQQGTDSVTHRPSNCTQIPLCCTSHDAFRDVSCEASLDESRNSPRNPNSQSPAGLYSDLFPWSPAVYANYHTELNCETCTDTRYQWSLGIPSGCTSLASTSCSGFANARVCGVSRCVAVCDFMRGSCYICDCNIRLGVTLAHHVMPPSRFISCVQCMLVRNAIEIQEYCKATGACTCVSTQNYNTTCPFVPQCAYTVSTGKAMIMGVAGDTFKYYIANEPCQSNLDRWLGFASVEGTAGSTICIAMMDQGYAPVHACWGSCSSWGFNKPICSACRCTAFLGCFGMTNTSITCACSISGASPCFSICVMENPDSAGCYRLFMAPLCDRC